MDKDKLKVLAEKLMFTMEDSEYDTLSKEFDIILKQMELIGEIPNIENVEPMTYPFPIDDVSLRKDEVKESVEIDDLLSNSNNTLYNQIKVPKVVE